MIILAVPVAADVSRSPASVSSRDHAVDLIKGVACFLMVVAHVPFKHAPWLNIVTMGSVLFFSSTGMNLWTILARARGDELRIAANGLFLIFAGFANNYVQGTLWMSDVFQSAGMAMLAVLILRWLLPGWWTWLFPLPFAVHWLNQNVYYWKISDGGLSSFFLAPGLFPLLPWLSFYLLGAHLQRDPARVMRLTIAAAALGACAVLSMTVGFHFDKFWMSTDYWLLALADIALTLELFRWWLRRRPRAPWAEVRYWGANSLVFYSLHSLVIRLLEIWIPAGPWLLLGAVAGTAALMRGALPLQDWSRQRPPAKILAACTAFSAGILWLESAYLSTYPAKSFVSFGLTLAFVVAYPAFKVASARLPVYWN